jgi:hypothetical protein
VNRHLSQRRLVALLREAAGIDEVEPDRRPWTGATVRLETAIRTKSTQRISLQQQDDSLALSTFPAELKPQAKALYQTGRTQRLRRQLDRIAVGTFAGPAGTFRQRTEITGAQQAILTRLGIDPPSRICQLIRLHPADQRKHLA